MPVITPRAIVLLHDPVLEKHGARKLHEHLGWHDPHALVQQYIDDISTASHGLVKYQITESHEVDGYPELVDGFTYTDEAYLQCWQARSRFHKPEGADYARLMQIVDFLPKVQAGLADELWLMGFPYAGYYESAMGGRDAFWCNAPVIGGTQHVSRRFIVMGFNFERDVGCMLEDMGHRAESILEHVFRNEIPTRNPWRQFSLYDKIARGHAACGNVHFAPNSERDYDWGNRRMVLSTADNWLDFPHGNRAARAMNCVEWGNGDMRAHHLWWLQHLPHTEGLSAGGISNNWWSYIVEPDRA